MNLECNNSNSFTSCNCFSHRWEKTLGKRRQKAAVMKTFSTQICIYVHFTFFYFLPQNQRQTRPTGLSPCHSWRYILVAFRLSTPPSPYISTLLCCQRRFRFQGPWTESKAACCSVTLSLLFMHMLLVAVVSLLFTATGVEADSQCFSLSLPLLLWTFSPTPLSLVVITQNKF